MLVKEKIPFNEAADDDFTLLRLLAHSSYCNSSSSEVIHSIQLRTAQHVDQTANTSTFVVLPY